MKLIITLLALWLTGFAMRVTLLAIPPIIPFMQVDLGLSQTDIGLLTGFPTLVFALLAIPGAALIARFGVLRALVFGMVLVLAAGAARAGVGGGGMLFAWTIIMAAGIAIMQPALPPLVRGWAPQHVGAATAVYTNGMLGAEAIATGLTLPVLWPLLGHSWRATLVAWSVPIALGVGLLLWRAASQRHAAVTIRPGRNWWPDWRDPRMWKLGLVTGGGSAVYYSLNAFLPGYLAGSGDTAWITPALAGINIGQIPPTILLLFTRRSFGLRRGTYVTMGLVIFFSVIGILTTHGGWMVAFCVAAGFCCGFTITLGFTLPALLAAPENVHRLAAAMIAVGYSFATIVPIIGGYLWDVTHVSTMAFVPTAAAALFVAAVGLCLHPERT